MFDMLTVHERPDGVDIMVTGNPQQGLRAFSRQRLGVWPFAYEITSDPHAPTGQRVRILRCTDPDRETQVMVVGVAHGSTGLPFNWEVYEVPDVTQVPLQGQAVPAIGRRVMTVPAEGYYTPEQQLTMGAMTAIAAVGTGLLVGGLIGGAGVLAPYLAGEADLLAWTARDAARRYMMLRIRNPIAAEETARFAAETLMYTFEAHGDIFARIRTAEGAATTAVDLITIHFMLQAPRRAGALAGPPPNGGESAAVDVPTRVVSVSQHGLTLRTTREAVLPISPQAARAQLRAAGGVPLVLNQEPMPTGPGVHGPGTVPPIERHPRSGVRELTFRRGGGANDPTPPSSTPRQAVNAGPMNEVNAQPPSPQDPRQRRILAIVRSTGDSSGNATQPSVTQTGAAGDPGRVIRRPTVSSQNDPGQTSSQPGSVANQREPAGAADTRRLPLPLPTDREREQISEYLRMLNRLRTLVDRRQGLEAAIEKAEPGRDRHQADRRHNNNERSIQELSRQIQEFLDNAAVTEDPQLRNLASHLGVMTDWPEPLVNDRSRSGVVVSQGPITTSVPMVGVRNPRNERGEVYACITVPPLEGATLNDLRQRLGEPHWDQDSSGYGSATWTFSDGSLIRLDFPNPALAAARDIYVSATTPHFSRQLPNGVHISEHGYVVATNSTPAHIISGHPRNATLARARQRQQP
jgi:hypothetical protein